MEKLRKILIICTALGLIFFGSFAFAQGQDILVEVYNEDTGQFENLGGGPIFNVENFAPENTITKIIRVHNYTQDPQTIGLKVTNFERGCQNNFCLADQLFLTIQDHYSGSLTEFYNADEVPLSEVEPGGYNEYELSVYFKPESGDEYQGLSTNFDLEIGFFTKETVSEEPRATGGAGYVLPIQGVVTQIIIKGPPTVTSGSATIQCETNIPAFCRVIYDTTSHPDLGNPPNYGYQWSTDATPKSTTHTITLSNLSSGTTYYYRVVCWASPYKITREYTFTTLAAPEKAKPPSEKKEGEKPSEEVIPEMPLSPLQEKTPPSKKIVLPGPTIPTVSVPTPISAPAPATLPASPILPAKTPAPGLFSGANLAAAIKDIVSSWPKLTLVVVLLLILAGIFGRRVYLFAKRKRQKS